MLQLARANYDYIAQTQRELSFQKEDLLSISSRLDSGWLQAELNGKSGLVPETYVIIIPQDATTSASSWQAPATTSPQLSTVKRQSQRAGGFGSRTNCPPPPPALPPLVVTQFASEIPPPLATQLLPRSNSGRLLLNPMRASSPPGSIVIANTEESLQAEQNRPRAHSNEQDELEKFALSLKLLEDQLHVHSKKRKQLEIAVRLILHNI